MSERHHVPAPDALRSRINMYVGDKLMKMASWPYQLVYKIQGTDKQPLSPSDPEHTAIGLESGAEQLDTVAGRITRGAIGVIGVGLLIRKLRHDR